MSSQSADGAPITGRLAPSPTGLLHLGHVRTFVLAWCSARSRAGRLLLRFDDLDAQRSKPEFADAALEDLAWLGLDWDEPITWQSSQQDRYAVALQQLTDMGLCYPCVCSRLDVQDAVAAPHQGQEGLEPHYPGTCRGLFASLEEARRKTGKAASLRYRVPEGFVEFDDRVWGPQRIDVAQSVGDFVVARRDGTAAYQLAVVVDDAAAGVTEVVRGADLLESTARQWLLQRSLGLAHPNWAHLPLLLDDQGRRLAKRSDSLSIRALRQAGCDPQRVVAWIARSVGLGVGDKCWPRELLSGFDLAKIAAEPERNTAPKMTALLG
ncbi:MAG TPA: tRNA glutamyl-Q(34) synthetase GluQRS [Polyangiaceae bacterium]|jgi:glutamyl-tRNA synthetase|nr:tRNA glutamyl-Q(34) synthetase GluQRS [Polyangiaceae bacterium]